MLIVQVRNHDTGEVIEVPARTEMLREYAEQIEQEQNEK